MGNDKLLLPVEALSYEDRLGLSAWINEKRILVGNAQLLRNHSVKAPDDSFEKKYTEDGKRVIYLSVEGQLAAMLVVSYYPSAPVKKGLNALVNQGITVLVTSRDSNITEEFIESSFGTGKNGVRVLTSASAEFFKECIENERSKEVPASVIHKQGASLLVLRICIGFEACKNRQDADSPLCGGRHRGSRNCSLYGNCRIYLQSGKHRYNTAPAFMDRTRLRTCNI